MITLPLAAFVISCSSQGNTGDFGLPSISIRLAPSELSRMRNGVFEKAKARGTIEIEGHEYRGTLSFAGVSSIHSPKKNFNLKLSEAYRQKTRYRLSMMDNDPSALRSLLAYHCFKLLGFDMPSSEPVSVWLNDEYAGLYLLQEKYDIEYFAARDLTPISLYKAKNSRARLDDTVDLGESFEPKIGHEEMPDLKEVVEAAHQKMHKGRLEKLEEVIDIDQLILYMAVSAYLHNTDGIINNLHFARTKEELRFRILPWDLDLTFRNTVSINNGKIFTRSHLMHRVLSDSEHYRKKYEAEFIALHEILTEARLSIYLDELQQTIEPAWNADKFLSNGDKSLDDHVRILKERFGAQDGLHP